MNLVLFDKVTSLSSECIRCVVKFRGRLCAAKDSFGLKVVVSPAQKAKELFEPTLLRDVTHAMDLFQKESFGPILPVAKVGSDEEALLCMNDSKLGLTAAVYTQDRDRAARMARDLEAGTVFMNRCDALDPALPWSGVKDTGRGVTLSSLGFDYLTRPKAIHFKLSL